MKRITLLVAMLAAGAGRHALAEEPHWTLWAEGGATRIHDDDQSGVGALRLQRDLDTRGIVRAQMGVVLALYGAVDAGLEVHPRPQGRVSPFLGAGLGLMGEEEYGGFFFRGTAGVEARASRSVVLRLALQAGTHDGQAGPHLATIGIGWRF